MFGPCLGTEFEKETAPSCPYVNVSTFNDANIYTEPDKKTIMFTITNDDDWDRFVLNFTFSQNYKTKLPVRAHNVFYLGFTTSFSSNPIERHHSSK